MTALRAAPTALGRFAHQARLLSTHQRGLRLLVLLCGPLVLGAATAAGARPGVFQWSVMTLLAVLAAAQPDSPAPAVTIGAAVGYWALAVPHHLSAWVVPAALAVLVLHCACALAALGPPGLRLDPVTGLRWARRTVLVGAATALVWGATWLADGAAAGGVLLPALALVTLTGLLLVAG